MDSTLTYKCPNCDAGLVFNAEKRRFICDFCVSEFTEEELADTSAARRAEEAERDDTELSSSVNEYYCPNCGAEVVADKETVASQCYYCHNPVVMADKVSGVFKPSKIIPFGISKEQAQESFVKYAKKKWFIPNGYFTKTHLDEIAGVYYPFWVTDADTDGECSGIARRVRSWQSGDYKYTETTRYSIYRRGRIHFEDITTSAISTEDRNMLEGILPYPSDAHIDFSMPYLQGFVAKKRNMERESLSQLVKCRMDGYARSLFSGTVRGYSSFDIQRLNQSILGSHWEYCLMPIWILTYVKKGKTREKDKTYIYAMNGYTGKIYGEFPLSIPKMIMLGVFTFILAAVIGGLFASLFM